MLFLHLLVVRLAFVKLRREVGAFKLQLNSTQLNAGSGRRLEGQSQAEMRGARERRDLLNSAYSTCAKCLIFA